MKFLFLFIGLSLVAAGQSYRSSRAEVPVVPREFRGAWVACVYNIDWPSRKGLAASQQKAELVRILDRMAAMRMNAIIFQVRPNADAAYRSEIEPWSHWLSGKQGKSPGYDPLQFCIEQGHARGIEVHAWFNPFRALPNAAIPVASSHVSKTKRGVIKRYKNYLWMDPSARTTQEQALRVILDVTRRYDVDGIHIDDYFYPYPEVDQAGRAKIDFPDGKSPEQRRAAVDSFVQRMYGSVKKAKPWVRVGISPFGIWRPGVPAGTTARIDAYHHLAADSRKWLAKGWCDYLSPQLYWRIEGPQGYTKLLTWWRAVGAQSGRPVWPGIAASRIQSDADPGRPAAEILNQVGLSRQVGRNYVGHIFWSMKSLMTNRGGISNELSAKYYQQPALTPPMPWLKRKRPIQPKVAAVAGGGKTVVTWGKVTGCPQYSVQGRFGGRWVTLAISAGTRYETKLEPEVIAVRAVDEFSNTSAPTVLAK